MTAQLDASDAKCILITMKELFREQDITRVSYYKAVLEENGIPTMIKNEYLTGSGLTEIPIPEFFSRLLCLE